jgi:hypothetical protein
MVTQSRRAGQCWRACLAFNTECTWAEPQPAEKLWRCRPYRKVTSLCCKGRVEKSDDLANNCRVPLFRPTVLASLLRSRVPGMARTHFRVHRIVPGPDAVTPFRAGAARLIARTLMGPPASHMISRTIRGNSPRAKCGLGLWNLSGRLRSRATAVIVASVSARDAVLGDQWFPTVQLLVDIQPLPA